MFVPILIPIWKPMFFFFFFTFKLLAVLSKRGQGTVFKALASLGDHPLPGKAIKLFFLLYPKCYLCISIQHQQTEAEFWPHVCHIYTTSSLSIHLSIDILIASMSCLLQTVLLWTLGCMYLFELCFSPDICPEVGLLDHMANLFLVFLRKLHTVFYSGCANLHLCNRVGGFPSKKHIFKKLSLRTINVAKILEFIILNATSEY